MQSTTNLSLVSAILVLAACGGGGGGTSGPFNPGTLTSQATYADTVSDTIIRFPRG